MAAKTKQPTQSDFQRISLDDLVAMQDREDVLMTKMSSLKEQCREWVDRYLVRHSIKGRKLQPE